MAGSLGSDDFDDFVVARSPALLQAAWLLTGDWQRGEDLLQTSLARAYLAWQRIRPGGHEAYVRRILVNTYATWWRRAWRGETPHARLPERPDVAADYESVELRRELQQALAALTRRQRATVVLRFYCDLSEAETAAAMDCSVGTVKSQTARALSRLRQSPPLRSVHEGTNHD
ncbi:MAG: SigE family RNA polymerase sigma factor [Marmoricola sp.]